MLYVDKSKAHLVSIIFTSFNQVVFNQMVFNFLFDFIGHALGYWIFGWQFGRGSGNKGIVYWEEC